MARKRKLAPRSTPQLQEPEQTIQEPSETETQTIQEPAVEPPIESQPPADADGQNPQTLEISDAADPNPSTTAVPAAGADDSAGATDPSSVDNLLHPFSKDQLLDLLRSAALRHQDVLSSIHSFADADPAHRRIFVHGLGWDATNETLLSAFRPHGEVEDCKAVIDKATGKSKGYGFVLFKHRSGASRALREPQKKIGNRMTTCHLAAAGHAAAPAPSPTLLEYTQRKIFVSNVGAELDPEKLLQFFAQFGEVEEGPMGLDKVTGKPKGFCLFLYKNAESVKKVLEEPHKNFEGHLLHCQRAIDGPKSSKPGFGRAVYTPHVSINGNPGFPSGVGNHTPQTRIGHLMAPPAVGIGFNQVAPAAPASGLSPALEQALTTLLANQGAGLASGLSPALEQALTTLLANQGAGLGLTNVLGAGGMANASGQWMQGSYGNHNAAIGGNMNPPPMGGGYRGPGQMQGGYGNGQMGQGIGWHQQNWGA